MNEDKDIYAELTSFGSDRLDASDAGIKLSCKQIYDGKGYYVTTRLSDIFGAEITEVEDPETGKPRRGLFLPFKNSGLTVTGRKDVLLVCKMELAQVASEKYTHLLMQILDATAAAEQKRMGYIRSFIGHARPFAPKQYKRRQFKKI